MRRILTLLLVLTTALSNAQTGGSYLSASIASLRSNLKTAKGQRFYITDVNREGYFYYNNTDNTSTDNGGTILVDAGGHRFYRSFSGAVNAQWFGAVGDGTTDNSTVLNTALVYCKNTKRDLYIPTGTYLCDVQTSGVSINMPAGAGMKIYGDKGTILTTTKKTGQLIALTSGAYAGITFDNIQFVSTHDTTNVGSSAIFIQGINPSLAKNITVTNCGFTGFAQALLLKGCQGVNISSNYFGAPTGHDCATTTTNPAVFIRLVDDSTGDLNRDFAVFNNVADGYSGTNVTTTKTGGPMDGFIYGHASGFSIHDNYLHRFAQESILAQPQLNVIDSGVTDIYNNRLNQYIPKGSKDVSGNPLRVNFAIRAEAQHLSIHDNTIVGATIGIWTDATNYNYVFRDVSIQNNHITFVRDTAARVQYGIYARGNATGVRMKNVIVKGNTLNLDSSFLYNTYRNVTLIYCDSAQVSNNTLSAVRVTESGGGTQAIALSTSDGIVLNSNLSVSADTAISSASSTTVSVDGSTNTYIPVLTNTTNITSSALNHAMYIRTGNSLHVRVAGVINPTTASAMCTLTLTLPFITSNSLQTYVGSGSYGNNAGASFSPAQVIMNNSNTVQYWFVPTTNTTGNFSLEFDYTL